VTQAGGVSNLLVGTDGEHDQHSTVGKDCGGQVETQCDGERIIDVDADGEEARVPQPLGSDTEDSSEEDIVPDMDTRILKMLRSGNMAEVNRAEERTRKAKVCNRKHDFYRNTRCTSTAQEEHSALPAGVINVLEDSNDEEDYNGEQLEIAKEMQELRAAQHWINQEGWDAASEAQGLSKKTQKTDIATLGLGRREEAVSRQHGRKG
jgi:hypothetical protein